MQGWSTRRATPKGDFSHARRGSCYMKGAAAPAFAFRRFYTAVTVIKRRMTQSLPLQIRRLNNGKDGLNSNVKDGNNFSQQTLRL